MFRENFLRSSLCPLALGQAEQTKLLQLYLAVEVVQTLHHLCRLLLGSLRYVPVSCMVEPRTPGVASPVQRKDCLLQPVGNGFFSDGAEHSTFAARTRCWLIFNLVSTRTPRSFSTKLSNWMSPSWCMELYLSGWRSLPFTFVVVMNSWQPISSVCQGLSGWQLDSGVSANPSTFTPSSNLPPFKSFPCAQPAYIDTSVLTFLSQIWVLSQCFFFVLEASGALGVITHHWWVLLSLT